MNELIWLVVLVISFIGVLAFYNYFGKTGLYVWSALAVVMANIQAVKLVNIFGLETVLGTIIYSTAFIVINIIIEKYGAKEAQKVIFISLAAMITVTLLMSLSVLYKPNVHDTANESLSLIFSINTRITIGSIIAYLVSQFCNMWLYQKLKKKYHKIWISNASTLVAQLIDTIIFLAIAFIGTYSLNILLEFFIARYIFKFIIAILGTSLIYATKEIKEP